MKTFNSKALQYVQTFGKTLGSETQITCPYCGYEDDNTWECGLQDDDVETWECRHCAKNFVVKCSVIRTFRSTPWEAI